MSNCEICGAPMPAGEEMFKFHGYSGPCPQPPIAKPKRLVVCEYAKVDETDGTFSIEIAVNGQPYDRIDNFATAGERDRALDDLLAMMRSVGARDGSGARN